MKTFAFWGYDLFPYLLGGEVDEKHNRLINGRIATYIPSYQSCFLPAFLLEVKAGRKLLEKLMDLRAESRSAHSKLDQEFLEKRNNLLLEYGINPKELDI